MFASFSPCCYLCFTDSRLAHLSKKTMTTYSLSNLFLYTCLSTDLSNSLCPLEETRDKVDFENNIIYDFKKCKEEKEH